MDYEIIRMYTEKLYVSAFQELIEKGSKIDLLVNVNTNLTNSNLDNNILLKINYDVVAKNAPISLNWVGVCILNFKDEFNNNMQAIDFFEDDSIRMFVDENISHFDMFINATLPKSSQILEIKDEN